MRSLLNIWISRPLPPVPFGARRHYTSKTNGITALDVQCSRPLGPYQATVSFDLTEWINKDLGITIVVVYYYTRIVETSTKFRRPTRITPQLLIIYPIKIIIWPTRLVRAGGRRPGRWRTRAGSQPPSPFPTNAETRGMHSRCKVRSF